MISSFGIEDFKSYKASSLTLSPLTVLIGANASGKSNALEALRLLAWIANGNKLNAVKYATQEGSKLMRGRVSELAYKGGSKFKLSCAAPLTTNIGSPAFYDRFSICLAATNDDELFIFDERITSRDTTVPLYEVVERHQQAGHDVLVAYNNFARGGIKPKVACMDQQAVFIQLESSARYSTSHRLSARIIPAVSQRLQDWLGGIHFLDPSPPAMRDYSFKTEQILSQNGSNLSGVLYNVCSGTGGPDKILDFIRSLPEQDIIDLSFVETPRGEVMVALTETFGEANSTFDATMLSDGTLRVLAVAAVMHSAPKGSLIVVEEIDNGVHPSRAGMLLKRISELAETRGVRVLMSSHNPALLDALPDKAIPDVVFCFRGPDGSSQLLKLDQMDRYPELVSQGALGELLTRGLIDKYAKSLEGKPSRRARSLDWLRSVS